VFGGARREGSGAFAFFAFFLSFFLLLALLPCIFSARQGVGEAEEGEKGKMERGRRPFVRGRRDTQTQMVDTVEAGRAAAQCGAVRERWEKLTESATAINYPNYSRRY
jgi:hypothetical protein